MFSDPRPSLRNFFSFSPYLSGILTTCGTGHIRFWKMATTFTGLKLQGEIGKFGEVEISDIAGFIEFPDGKVLSGTETGDTLIWTSGQIMCTVFREGKKPCHDGMVETIRLTKDENIIVTSGMDGFVRYWDFSELDVAETEEGCDFIEVEPIKEVSIQGSQIKHIVYAEDHWLVQDQGGSLLKYSLQDRSTTKLLEFHSNSITDMATLPRSHQALTAGADGTVNLYDIRKRKVVIRSSFNTGATSMLVLGPKADHTGRTDCGLRGWCGAGLAPVPGHLEAVWGFQVPQKAHHMSGRLGGREATGHSLARFDRVLFHKHC